MNANKFSSEYLKNAMNAKIQKIIIAKTNQTHFALELLKVENAHKAKTTHTAKIINCMKLIVNPITEIATPEKNHFCICWGNITFMDDITNRIKHSVVNYILFF